MLLLKVRRLRFQRLLKVPMTEAISATSAPAEAEMRVADTVGRLMHFWGFKRPMGRLWTILYLSPAPMTAQGLGDKLQMSAGAVSMGLAELEKWGAVSRTWKPGDRRDYFAAEDSIWRLVQRVIRERELGIVQEFGASLSEATGALSTLQADAHEDLASELSYKRERLEHLSSLSRAGETLLGALVQGDAIDPSLLLRKQDKVQS